MAHREPRRIKPPVYLFAVAVLLGLLYYVIGLPLKSARKDWLEGSNARAIETLEQWARLRLRPADYDHSLAVAYLSLGKIKEATPFLTRISARQPEWFPVIRKGEVARRLVEMGRYEEFLRYDSVVAQRGESDDVPLYRAAALLGTGRTAQADVAFRSIPQGDVDARMYAALSSALEQRRGGTFPYVLDRKGKTIAAYHLENGDVVPLNADFAPLVDKSGGELTFESRVGSLGTASTIETTLDSFVQKAAVISLGATRGSLVAIDTKNHEILAIASTAGPGGLRNLALEEQYEPGSVLKVLTALNAVEAKLPLAELFPMTCGGFLVLNNRQFFDWAKHGEIHDLNEAMATSCNVAFASLGIRIGGERLEKFMASAGLDGQADLQVFSVPLGKTKRPVYTYEYEVATYSVGLEHQTINALHLAMIGSMVANGGTMHSPKLVLARRSMLGERVAQGQETPATSVVVAPPAAARIVTAAMEAVVTNPRGTGRRTAVPGLRIAMKTGTAGSPHPNYDALVVAFVPADNPRVAIGIIAEHAGPAEFAGAKIAHDFLTQIKDHLGLQTPP